MGGVSKQMFNWTKFLCIHFQEDINNNTGKTKTIHIVL